MNAEILTKIELKYFMKSENSILSALKATFPKSNKENWRRAASQEIDGKDPYVDLRWEGQDNLQFQPYYDHSDTISSLYLEKFSISPAENSFVGPRQWLCMPSVEIKDELTANKIALDHLANGADGILFNTKPIDNLDLSKLLQQIEWPYCSLSFQPGDLIFFENILPTFIGKNTADPSRLKGTLFWDTFPKKVDPSYYFKTTKNFKPFGLIVKQPSGLKEIAEALTSAVRFFEEIADENKTEQTFSSIAFSLSAGTNFLETVSRLKVLRMLWFQIAQAYGLTKFRNEDLHIHARSDVWSSENFQPHANMLKATTASIASICGGCDSLTIVPEDEHNSVMNRIARNVSSILREESHLNKVADPMSGSFALDSMQQEMAAHVWKLFQSNITK